MNDFTRPEPSVASGRLENLRFSSDQGPPPATPPKGVLPREPGMSRHALITIAMVILIPSMYGFLGKFIEFVHISRGEEGGEFAVAPIMNYLLASAGFFCMLLWAAWNGMFRDIEQPKYDFLDNEARIDAATKARGQAAS